MIPSGKKTTADAAAEGEMRSRTSNDQLPIENDINENRDDGGEGQDLPTAAELRVLSYSDEDVLWGREHESVLRRQQERQLVVKEKARIEESGRTSNNIMVFVDLRLVVTPAKIQRAVTFVIQPQLLLLCLMVMREWRSSVSLLTELKVPMLTLITCLADVEVTVAIDGTTQNVRERAESVVFVLLVLAKLLFSVRQIPWLKRILGVMWARFRTPVFLDTVQGSECFVCAARALPDLLGSKTRPGLPWQHNPSGSSSDQLLRACARVTEALAGNEKGQLVPVLHKHGPHIWAFHLENAFAALVWMSAMYVAVLVTITMLEMFLDAATDVSTLYLSYKRHRCICVSTRRKALHEALQQYLRDPECALRVLIERRLRELPVWNHGPGADVAPTGSDADE